MTDSTVSWKLEKLGELVEGWRSVLPVGERVNVTGLPDSTAPPVLLKHSQ